MTVPGSKKPRLHMLDGLRGVCAVSIMFYHYSLWGGVSFFQIGTFGVYLFFMLSGFSLWYVYASATLDAIAIHAFFVARFARIFPLYLLFNLKYLIKLLHITDRSLTNLNFFLLNSTFLFGVAEPGHTSSVTGGWSIGIEWVFYLAFPLLWIFVRKLSTMIFLLVLTILINQVYVAIALSDNTLEAKWEEYVNFPVFLVYFIAGISCAELYKKLQNKHFTVHQWFPVIGRAAIVLCLGFIFFFPSDSVEHYLLGYHFPLLILAGMLAVLLCALIAPSGWEASLYKFLGNVSFGVYLLHPVTYSVVQKQLFPRLPSISGDYVLMAAAVGNILMAYLIYRFYEMPARRWITTRYKKT